MKNTIEVKLEKEKINYKVYAPYKHSDYIQRTILESGKPYEYELLQLMLSYLKDDDCVLDVGMNIGNHSLFFAANGFKVIGLEANPKMREIAQKSIEINGFENLIKIIPQGVSDKEETLYFKREIYNNYGGMSLANDGNKNLGEIYCNTLDSLNLQENFKIIKLDIEGMEAKALNGARELIAKNRPLIFAEANYTDDFLKVARVLDGMGYACVDSFGENTMHFFMPLELVSEKQLLAYNANKITRLTSEVWEIKREMQRQNYFQRFSMRFKNSCKKRFKKYILRV